jgi:acetylglutamate kinase
MTSKTPSAPNLAIADPAVKAATLSAALPYFRRYAGKTIVVKYGGHAMGDSENCRQFAEDVVLLKQVGMNPIVVHGGGPQIGEMLKRLKVKSSFVDGLRVTDQDTVEIVEMVLSGSVNKEIVGAINKAGGLAVGLSGKDADLIRARKLDRTTTDPDSHIEKVLDLGFVGEPYAINAKVLDIFESSAIIPVIAPIGVGDNGETYNINADTVAGAVAAAVKATRFLLLTDVAGVLDKEKRLLPQLTAEEARALITDGTIRGGMIPKVETCLDAIKGGVEAAVIIDGRVPHAILLELFAEGAGTLIRRGK